MKSTTKFNRAIYKKAIINVTITDNDVYTITQIKNDSLKNRSIKNEDKTKIKAGIT
jgi:hypothetical protein